MNNTYTYSGVSGCGIVNPQVDNVEVARNEMESFRMPYMALEQDSTDYQITSFRRSLHCQRILETVSTRLQSFFGDFEAACNQKDESLVGSASTYLNTVRRFRSAGRILQQKCLMESRDLVAKYLDLYYNYDKNREEYSRFAEAGATKLQIYREKIKSLEDQLVKSHRKGQEESMSTRLMQESWEREKEVLRLQWEAETSKNNHALLTRMVEEAANREKLHLGKLDGQKISEINSIKMSLETQKQAELELLKNKISVQCKVEMERQMKESYNELETRNKKLGAEYKLNVQQLEDRMKSMQEKLHKKDLELLERDAMIQRLRSEAVERENSLRKSFGEQLALERQHLANLKYDSYDYHAFQKDCKK